jgi:predicted DNA-binding mobile mystery protein A
LRRAAEALDCTLVYALVPNSSLEAVIEARARKIATRELHRVSHTMRLEAQGTDDVDFEARVQAYIRDRLSERDLWKET